MAYGLNVADLVYTDPDLNDIGILEEYSVDLDINGEKTFELECDSFVMDKGSIWYVEDTEFGGIVDGYETNSNEQDVKYSGRSWRGILNNKIVFNGDEVAIQDPNDNDDSILVTRQFNFNGYVKDIFNDLIKEYKLDSFFVCEDCVLSEEDYLNGMDYASSNPIEEHESTTVLNEDGSYSSEDDESYASEYDGPITIGSGGVSVYSIMDTIAVRNNLCLVLRYEQRDRRVHIYPVSSNDYTDMMTYNRDNTNVFETKVDWNIPNHLIIIGEQSVDKYKINKIIHLFLNKDYQLMPYTYEPNPNERIDDNYILDTSQQVIDGIHEKVDVITTTFSTVPRYFVLSESTAPEDWNEHFSSYYTYTPEQIDETTGELIEGSYQPVTGNENERYQLVTEKPANWDTTFNQYYEYQEDNWDAFTGEWSPSYTAISETEEVDYDATKATKVTSDEAPSNWKDRWNDYCKLVYNGGDEPELEPYSGNQENVFERIKTKPTGWDKGTYINYFRVVKQEAYGKGKDTLKAIQKRMEERKTNGLISDYFIDKTSQKVYGLIQMSEETDNEPVKITGEEYKAVKDDWAKVYGNYYYRLSTAVKGKTYWTYQSYSSKSKSVFVKLTGDKPPQSPYSWKKERTSYFKKVAKYSKNNLTKRGRDSLIKKIKKAKKSNKKKKTKVDKYICEKISGKNRWRVSAFCSVGKKAKYKKNRYYREDSKEIRPSIKSNNVYRLKSVPKNIPTFKPNTFWKISTKDTVATYDKNNCYLPRKIKVHPEFEDQDVYERIQNVYTPPEYIPDNYYEMREDNYAEMVSAGIDYFKELLNNDSHTMTIPDDYILNIGDKVAGFDDFTMTTYEDRYISNIIVKIESGALNIEYRMEDELDEYAIPLVNLEPDNIDLDEPVDEDAEEPSDDSYDPEDEE